MRKDGRSWEEAVEIASMAQGLLRIGVSATASRVGVSISGLGRPQGHSILLK